MSLLLVSGLHSKFTTDDIQFLFSRYGRIVRVLELYYHVLDFRHEMIVEYADKGSAEAATRGAILVDDGRKIFDNPPTLRVIEEVKNFTHFEGMLQKLLNDIAAMYSLYSEMQRGLVDQNESLYLTSIWARFSDALGRSLVSSRL